MKAYKSGVKPAKNWIKFIVFGLVICVLFGAGLFVYVSRYYKKSLEPVNLQSTEDINFTLSEGMTTPRIAQSLKDKKLIRNATSFTQYVRSNELGEKFIAGTYKLRQSMSVSEITNMLTEGRVATDLFTIYPGSNLTQIRKQLAEKTHFTAEQIDEALDPGRYKDHPALVDLPAGASLEGFLYPDSYQFIAETTPEDIVNQSLDEMADALTPEIRAGIAKQGLSVYQGVILASIVEREVGERGTDGQVNNNRATVAQVFLKRLSSGMKLQSNATDGYPANFDTYNISGLPPEPISNVSTSSLRAVANPSATNYLYFVSGSDCVTRFSNTNEEHDALKSAHGVAKPEDNCQG